MPPDRFTRGLPALTITITPAPSGSICGIGRKYTPHPATERYDYSDHGASIYRCAEHGGEPMRKSLRGKGHKVVDLVAP